MDWMEIWKAAILGLIEGVTEWLPISSTGHMILADEFIRLEVSPAFKEMFLVLIQLGAILAVVVLYWERLCPLSLGRRPALKREVLSVWIKILIACVPAAVVGFLLDDWIEARFFNYQTVSVTLILYGALFLVIESRNAKHAPGIRHISQMPVRTALLIGVFQLLALIPGTSRSGATILGAILLGTSRTLAAEFTFYLAVPVMLGASLLKLVKFGFFFTRTEAAALLTGMLSAFLVSVLAIKFLLGYVRKNDFKAFGWYRIALGLTVLSYFSAKTWGLL